MKDIHQAMQAYIDQKVAEGSERGVQLAVYYRGELIVDVCSGLAEAEAGKRVDANTLFPVFSGRRE